MRRGRDVAEADRGHDGHREVDGTDAVDRLVERVRVGCVQAHVRRSEAEQERWDDQREAFGDTVIDTLSQYAPNLKDIILHRQVVTPLDLERTWALSEGNIFQGELSLEQLFFLRPVPGWARYRTPVDGLFMCGSATHPGGGIMGAPGRNAALAVLNGKIK